MENKELKTTESELITSLVINGDLSKLTQNQKIQYYTAYCNRLGLDPLTQPFKIMTLQGKQTLYCDRGGTQQLSKLHNVSHVITSREKHGDVYIVTAKATVDGRSTESTGVVSIASLKGDALCNALMKAETKAKRRATLDLLGLGILDESEVATIPNATTIDVEAEVVTHSIDAASTDVNLQAAKDSLIACTTLEALSKCWSANKKFQNNKSFSDLKDLRKEFIQDVINQENAVDEQYEQPDYSNDDRVRLMQEREDRMMEWGEE